MERITIIGLGLIGGSLGLALKAARLKNVEIVGHDRDAEVTARARKRGAVDQGEWNLISAVRTADMVIIATPVQAVREIFTQVAQHLPEGCVVTDTASTKAEVMTWAEELLPEHVSFIGGHPMAGKESTGIDAADATLFQNSMYCLLPSARASQGAIDSCLGLARTAGATPYFVDAHEHDGFAAAISHLPLVMSAALVSTVASAPSWREVARLASSGFRDVSRLASGDEEMSRDICITNRESLVRWIDRFVEVMLHYRRLVADEPERLGQEFRAAREARDRWLAIKAGLVTDEPKVEIPTASQAMQDIFLGRGFGRVIKGLEETKRAPRPPEPR